MSAVKADSAPGEQAGRIKLLIVDDDPTTCELLALQLEMEGYVCATLSDPDLVLEVISEESPMLILMDYHLGARHGLDVLRAIRSQEGWGHLPVVVMSAIDHQEESEAADANGFVLKPFDLNDLLMTVQGVLARQEA